MSEQTETSVDTLKLDDTQMAELQAKISEQLSEQFKLQHTVNSEIHKTLAQHAGMLSAVNDLLNKMFATMLRNNLTIDGMSQPETPSEDPTE